MKTCPDEPGLSANGAAMLAHARRAGLTVERVGSARVWHIHGTGVDLRVSDPRWLQPRDLRPVRR
ncbi:MAG: hypothetical protein E6R11_06060 [Rhodocyclaceae bacterium]|nr:MAG: hypothetical protein E6R11_06060 [Rhodocyclaceae bacterium]